MEYVYAALLLHKLGNPINEENVKKILQASGAKVEDGKVKALVSALEGVDIEQAIKEGSMVAAPVAVAASGHSAVKTEEKKEEKKDDTQAAAGLGSLFG
jgi:large subunit ribosomal protein L12